MNTEEFVIRLREAREKKNITIRALATACDVSLSAMNRYATCTSMPPLDVAVKMAQVLGVSLDWLCGLTGQCGEELTVGATMRMLSRLLTVYRSRAEQETETFATFAPSIRGRLSISIDSTAFPVDFVSWNKFIGLYRNHTIDKEMYDAWLEKKASECDHISIPLPASMFPGFLYGVPVQDDEEEEGGNA